MGRVKRFLQRFPLRWDSLDWSLDLVESRWKDGHPHQLRMLFALRCWKCGTFNPFRCKEHWFCELCTVCNKKLEAEG